MWAENKNRFILSFCAVLIFKDIFVEIEINYLPKDHTHENVDRFFIVKKVIEIPECFDFEGLLQFLEAGLWSSIWVVWAFCVGLKALAEIAFETYCYIIKYRSLSLYIVLKHNIYYLLISITYIPGNIYIF